ncbi:MAG: hypothetical protein V2J07_04500 [Anaerolineae bacterium]|jgi:hypothetical protein|nr:hypothetical protein [Anaerolineae bacterium]
MKKNTTSIVKISRCLMVVLISLGLLSFSLAGCQEAPEPVDYAFSSPRFFANITTDREGTVQASLGFRNTGNDPFPGDDSFNGRMNLWQETGELRAQMQINALQELPADGEVELATANWELDAGNYILHWGAEEYGSIAVIFSVSTSGDQPQIGKSLSFEMKPIRYEGSIRTAGSVQTFLQEDSGMTVLMGETPIPDGGHLFPLMFGPDGIVDGFPAGTYAPIAEGRWRLEIPAQAIQLDPAQTYTVLLMCDDLSIAPSEPFIVDLSPPA